MFLSSEKKQQIYSSDERYARRFQYVGRDTIFGRSLSQIGKSPTTSLSRYIVIIPLYNYYVAKIFVKDIFG